MASGSGPVKKNRIADKRRRFLPAWKASIRECSWKMALCTANIAKTWENNAFTTSSDNVKKHVFTVYHCVALVAKSGRKDVKQAVNTVYRNQEHAVRAALHTVYFMVKIKLPTDIFSDLKQFEVLQSHQIINMSSTSNFQYPHENIN